MKPLNVLFVINSLGTGGAERSLAEMLSHLADLGVRPSIACLYHRREGVEKDVVRRGYRVHFLPGRRLLARVRGLRRVLAQERPDLIHTVIFESTLTGGLAALGMSLPVMTSLVNTSYAAARLRDPNIRPMGLRTVRLIDGWVCRHLTTHFHAITETVKAAAVRTLGIPPERISVVERGRDPARLGLPGRERRGEVRRRLGIGDDAEILINVARQEYQKGQRYLLEAMTILLPQRPRLQLLVAGRVGHSSGELERFRTQSGLEERVHFLGYREDVPDLLAAADLFVFPSLWEGLGGALLEAMALALPIVASDVDAIREVVEVGRNALLVPPASPRELASAVAALLDDRARAVAFGARSREIFQERFTLDRSARRMVDLYHQVATAAGRRASELRLPSGASGQ